MQNDATTAISSADMKKFISLSSHEAEVIDFSKISEAPATGDKKEEAKKPAHKVVKHEKKEEVKQDVHQLGIEYTKEQNFSKWYS